MKWILGTLGLLLAGMLLKLSLLVYAMYVLLGVLLLSRFFTRAWMENIETFRDCDREIVEIGEIATVEVTIINRGRLRVPWMILEDSLPREGFSPGPARIRTEGSRRAIIELNPKEQERLSYQVTFLMRGYYQMGPLLLETGDLFGLHRRYCIAADPRFVMVIPRVLPLQGYNLASRRPIGEIRLAHRLFEDPTRIAAIRPYQQGDPLNRIHWRATARTGQLHSRVYESSCVAGATFLLDFHQAGYRGGSATAGAELAVTTVASLANAVYLMGQQVGFISNGRDAAERIRQEGWQAEFSTRSIAQQRAADSGKSDRLLPVVVKTRKGEAQLTQILHTLARLEHTDGMTFSDMVTETASELPRDATVVAVLSEVSPATAISLGNLVRQGYAVTAVVVTWDVHAIPDWAQAPYWAALLLDEGVDFRQVNSEEALISLCAEAVVK